jgi:pyruvate dehydrogenase E2 component (dihydrolipoamide acetyltransferase)
MDIALPKLGENIPSADVVRVLVAVGATVQKDQPLIEMETNKATVELPSPVGGVVREVLVSEGSQAQVGQTIMRIDEAPAPAGPPPAPPAPDAREAADKPRPSDQGSGPAAPPPAEPEAERPAAPPQTAPARDPSTVPAAPSVRRLAREMGIDLALVAGSGPHGRVSIDDVKRHGPERDESRAAGGIPTPGGVPAGLPDFATWGPVRRERMSHIRRLTAEHVAQCWLQVAHVTQFDKADITKLEGLRKRYAGRAEEAGGKLTMAVMVVKVAASALRVFPKFNASIDMAAREVIFKDYVHVGIAVATPRGLLVPVLRDVDRKNMIQIAADVTRIAEATRNGTVSPGDLQGGTFTVTNLGNIGGTHFTPIVNHPEVAILGMGRAYTEAGFEDGVCKPRIVLPLSLSYDHRLIDGAEGARFLRWIAEAIEEPLLLALEG